MSKLSQSHRKLPTPKFLLLNHFWADSNSALRSRSSTAFASTADQSLISPGSSGADILSACMASPLNEKTEGTQVDFREVMFLPDAGDVLQPHNKPPGSPISPVGQCR